MTYWEVYRVSKAATPSMERNLLLKKEKTSHQNHLPLTQHQLVRLIPIYKLSMQKTVTA